MGSWGAPRPLATTPVGLYVHVPFCLRRCGYCAFNTYAVEGTDPSGRYASYLDGVRRELDRAAVALAGAPPLGSIYLGGGTPTLLGAHALAQILHAVRQRLDVAPDAEVTVEANPDTVDRRSLGALTACGFDRLSVGMQSADPAVLRLLDRAHEADRAPATVALGRDAGFRSINLDLIAGTPGETADSWRRTVAAALAAGPDHLSVYSLTIEPGTRLAARVRSGALPPPDDGDQADRYLWTDERLRGAGYHWYELSNWARSGEHRSRHNLTYWRNFHWWGIGPGAHSHLAGRRWWNERDPERWARLLADGSDPAAGGEDVDHSASRTEELLLAVRLADGIPTNDLDPAAVATLTGDGLVHALGPDRVVLTTRGRLLADDVVLALL